jgi:polyphosphate kinase
MPRNFRRRVEVMYPILDDSLRRRVIDEILGTTWNDSVKAWSLRSDGSYSRLVPKDDENVRSQQRFIDLTRERARETEAILGLSGKSALPGPVRALDKLRRRGKKRKRQRRGD